MLHTWAPVVVVVVVLVVARVPAAHRCELAMYGLALTDMSWRRGIWHAQR